MDKQWQKQLRREASAHGMCAENRHALEGVESKRDAIRLYKKTIDWALEEGYPSLEAIRQHFSDCEIEGIFVDKHFDGEILDRSKVYVFHHCTGTIRTGLNVDLRIIPMLYFANGCDMIVKGAPGVSRPVSVPLYIFGDNRIEAEPSEAIEYRTFKLGVK